MLVAMPAYRREIKRTSMRLRAGALCAREKQRRRLLLRTAGLLLVLDVITYRRQYPGERYRILDDRRQVRGLAMAALLCLVVRCKLAHAVPLYLQPRVHRDLTLEDLDDAQCWDLLRIRKLDFPRLKAALRLPDDFIVTENRCMFTTDEALMLFLRRMSYPQRLTDLVSFWGRSPDQWSRVFKYMLHHIYSTFERVLQDSIHVWVPHFPRFAAKVREKCNTPAQFADVVCFVDGTVRPCSRPQGRDDVQREVYSGHKRVHGIKFQAVTLPNGIIADVSGPYSGRRHDSYLMTESRLNDRIAAAQIGQLVQYKVFGDKAYAMLSHVRRAWPDNINGNGVLTAAQRHENRNLAGARICAEWAYGEVVKYWAFVDFKKNLKLFVQPVAKVYLVAVFLTNCHTCLYGSETSAQFGVRPPTLEEYCNILDCL